LAWLERFHDGPVAAEVVQLARRWTKRWGRGVLAAVTLLRVESVELADPGLGSYMRLGFFDRGTLRLGAAADVVVFDAEQIRDTATTTTRGG
jgi:N-acyl-D-aspartate/D-glutamate deacylase